MHQACLSEHWFGTLAVLKALLILLDTAKFRNIIIVKNNSVLTTDSRLKIQ